MTATLTRSENRQRIDLLEALESVRFAIDDVSSVEWAAGDRDEMNLAVTDRNGSQLSITFVHALPQEVVLAGLQAMRKALEEKL
jgi:hypothetical protein